MSQPIHRRNTQPDIVLNAKQERFVQSYLATLNATQAAIQAGYSRRTATQTGSRLLTHVHVSAAIRAGREGLQASSSVNNGQIIAELARIAFFDIGQLYDEQGALKSLHLMDVDCRRALASAETQEILSDGAVVGLARKIKAADKLKALELLMRHLGMLNDKLTLKGDTEDPLTLLIKQVQGSAIKPREQPSTRAL